MRIAQVKIVGTDGYEGGYFVDRAQAEAELTAKIMDFHRHPRASGSSGLFIVPGDYCWQWNTQQQRYEWGASEEERG